MLLVSYAEAGHRILHSGGGTRATSDRNCTEDQWYPRVGAAELMDRVLRHPSMQVPVRRATPAGFSTNKVVYRMCEYFVSQAACISVPVWTTYQVAHMIPTFTSSNPLTGRTDRLHIFQTLVPSYRAQVFISSQAACTPRMWPIMSQARQTLLIHRFP